jgi:hypothetical protein
LPAGLGVPPSTSDRVLETAGATVQGEHSPAATHARNGDIPESWFLNLIAAAWRDARGDAIAGRWPGQPAGFTGSQGTMRNESNQFQENAA